MNSYILKDKIVLITGSSRGIGKATAKKMVMEGARLVIHGRDPKRLRAVKEELKALGGTVVSFSCDITNPDQAKDLIDYTIGIYGQLDILINNAGVSMRGAFKDLNPIVFKKVFDINVLGVANVSINALPYIKQSHGSLVFISSVAGIRGLPGNSAYSSSKMALKAIAESLRIEEFKSKIHIGLIYVGITEIEKGKKTIGSDGSEKYLKDRSKLKVQSLNSVASSIISNIKKRKYKSTLSILGKLNAVIQSIAPKLVEFILLRSQRRIILRSE